MAFTDEMIAAAVRTGAYSDPRAEAYLTEVLIARRDAIGRAYLPAITPLAEFAFDPATGVSFVNVAERAKVAEAPAEGYRAQWLQVDNATGTGTPIGGEVRADGPLVPAPGAAARGRRRRARREAVGRRYAVPRLDSAGRGVVHARGRRLAAGRR